MEFRDKEYDDKVSELSDKIMKTIDGKNISIILESLNLTMMSIICMSVDDYNKRIQIAHSMTEDFILKIRGCNNPDADKIIREMGNRRTIN